MVLDQVSRRAYFVVERRMGREQPAIYWDELPHRPIRNLDYIVRLDLLPNAEALMHASLAELFRIYRALKQRGKLPPRWEPPSPRKKEAAAENARHAD
jgi:hypothetical protein